MLRGTKRIFFRPIYHHFLFFIEIKGKGSVHFETVRGIKEEVLIRLSGKFQPDLAKILEVIAV